MVPTPMRYFSPREVGEIVGTSADTIRRLIRADRLKAVRMPPGNHYKIAADEVLRYTAEYNLPLPNGTRQMLEEMTVGETTL